MAENENNSSLRRYNNNNLINNDHIDEENNRTNSNHEQLIPISIEYLSTPVTISNKRRRCSMTNEQSLSTQLYSNNQDFIYDRNLNLTSTIGTRKRSAQDDLVTFTTHQFLHEHEPFTYKRARYENSNNNNNNKIELENQPPHLTNKRRSLFFHQQQQQQQQPIEDNLLSTWNNHQTTNDISLFFNNIPSSLLHPTTYHRTNSVPNHEHNLSNQYSSLLTEQQQHSSIFHNSLITSNQKSTISKSSKTNIRLNSSSPLRTTNFLFDNKQQTIIRTGNISPAHSDSSTESTSTCSSDEQLHQQQQQQQHHHHYHLFQQQPWRSYRERENYEQLLDLAEKLSDPNRFNKVDIQQFFSYRYKIPIITSTILSKQTACVICMSHFKNGQHIRVLPCQHEYHSKCIARWFAMNSSCPICRRDNFLSTC
ncbi:unnamed protein product [Rotaria sp. Silwood1]|nr:unnamed protein product [Rotaria sp. Silwood1]CAF1493193.1 unnamed protein product [Rotaria sp. Silwood1]CAF3634365.1 unnamed protein product [Rotaria sp. Silwood1]